MACGLPVVEVQKPSIQWAYLSSSKPGSPIVLAVPTPQGLANSICDILFASDREQEQFRKNAFALVKDLSWNESGEAIKRALLN